MKGIREIIKKNYNTKKIRHQCIFAYLTYLIKEIQMIDIRYAKKYVPHKKRPIYTTQ